MFLMAEGERIWYWRNRTENERWFWEIFAWDRLIFRESSVFPAKLRSCQMHRLTEAESLKFEYSFCLQILQHSVIEILFWDVVCHLVITSSMLTNACNWAHVRASYLKVNCITRLVSGHLSLYLWVICMPAHAAIICSVAYQYIVPNNLIWVVVVPMVFIAWQTGRVPGPFDLEFWLIAYFGVYKKCW